MSSENRVADQGPIRANKLELVERLADDLAHEIKNPLHSMVINLEVLRRRLARLESVPGDDLLRYASVLGSELERVNRRVDLLLRLVRPARDSEDLATLSEIVEELRELLELECQRHGANLEITPPRTIERPELPRASTRQVLLTLMLDTLDRTPRGGTLHLRTADLEEGNRIDIYTTMSSEALPNGPHPTDGTAFLPVARTLAERIGCQLVTMDDAPASGDPDNHLQVGFSLTFPKRR